MIEVRQTSPGDLPGLDALFQQAFGHGLTPENWHWKYRQPPGRTLSLVGLSAEGEVLAHVGALCLPAVGRLADGGSDGTGGLDADSTPDREGGLWQLVDFAGTTRGRGLRAPLLPTLRRLLDAVPEDGDLPWVFAFPSPRNFRIGEHLFGYRRWGEVVPRVGELPAGGDAGRVQASDRLDPGDPLPARAWESCCRHGIRRDAGFLNWRYHDRPERYYRYYRLTADDGTGGLAVFAFIERQAWAAELWLPPAPGWYDALLAVSADLRAGGLESWRFWPPPAASRLDPVFERLGLRPVDEAHFVGCRAAPGGPDPVQSSAGFYFSMGDYDAV